MRGCGRGREETAPLPQEKAKESKAAFSWGYLSASRCCSLGDSGEMRSDYMSSRKQPFLRVDVVRLRQGGGHRLGARKPCCLPKGPPPPLHVCLLRSHLQCPRFLGMLLAISFGNPKFPETQHLFLGSGSKGCGELGGINYLNIGDQNARSPPHE